MKIINHLDWRHFLAVEENETLPAYGACSIAKPPQTVKVQLTITASC